MPVSLPYQTKISQQSSAQTEYQINVVKYGNGYEQRAKAGINNRVDKWSITWKSLTGVEYVALMAAFDTNMGTDYFTWTAFGDAAEKKWVLDGPIPKLAQSGSYYTVTLPLRQVFDL